MKKIIQLFAAGLLLSACTPSGQSYEAKEIASKVPVQEVTVINNGNVIFGDFFTDKTMRMDYFHTGNAKGEEFAVDQVVSDGPWPGSKTILIDPLKLGLYFYEVIDKKSGILLYSRGFASVFGEWQTIPEAETRYGTFHESIRFPWPKGPVTILMKRRDEQNNFKTIWTNDIDPASRQVNPADIKHTNKVDVIADNGPANLKVDLVVLGDGYSKDEMQKFRDDAKRLTDVLLETEPYKSRKSDINIRAVETPGEESGVTKPHPGIFKRTPLSTHYSSFDSERYVLTYDNRTVRDVASQVPYDFMVILINEKTYGGGGIYNLYTTVSVDNKFSDYIMVHELGHHIAALADEYYTSAVAYEVPEIKVEPWETNITALLDPANLKWKSLVEEGTPIPTPWNKTEFDAYEYGVQKERDSLRKAKVPEAVVENLFQIEKNREDEIFSQDKYKDKVGAFEGGGYTPKGLYRPQLDCIMFTRHMEFCKVCRKSLNDVMDTFTK